MKLRYRACYAPCAFALAFLLFSLTISACVRFAVAAPASGTATKPAQALSFHATARFIDRATDAGSPMPQQVFAAKVMVKGNRVRIETRLSDQPVVFLYASPYIYKLLPDSKAGVRWRAERSPDRLLTDAANLDLQALLRNPTAIRTALQKQGARKVASTTLNGTPADVFETRNFRGKRQHVKAWLRRTDALPLRLESTSRTLSTIVSWRNYQRGPLKDSLFQVPTGYNIRNVQGQPNIL